MLTSCLEKFFGMGRVGGAREQHQSARMLESRWRVLREQCVVTAAERHSATPGPPESHMCR